MNEIGGTGCSAKRGWYAREGKGASAEGWTRVFGWLVEYLTGK